MSPRGRQETPLQGKPELVGGLGPRRPENWPAQALDESAVVDPILFAGDATAAREERERQIIEQALDDRGGLMESTIHDSGPTMNDLKPILDKFCDQLLRIEFAAANAARSIRELNDQQARLHRAEGSPREFWLQIGLGILILVGLIGFFWSKGAFR